MSKNKKEINKLPLEVVYFQVWRLISKWNKRDGEGDKSQKTIQIFLHLFIIMANYLAEY